VEVAAGGGLIGALLVLFIPEEQAILQ